MTSTKQFAKYLDSICKPESITTWPQEVRRIPQEIFFHGEESNIIGIPDFHDGRFKVDYSLEERTLKTKDEYYGFNRSKRDTGTLASGMSRWDLMVQRNLARRHFAIACFPDAKDRTSRALALLNKSTTKEESFEELCRTSTSLFNLFHYNLVAQLDAFRPKNWTGNYALANFSYKDNVESRSYERRRYNELRFSDLLAQVGNRTLGFAKKPWFLVKRLLNTTVENGAQFEDQMSLLRLLVDWDALLKYSLAEAFGSLITANARRQIMGPDIPEVRTGVQIHNIKMQLLIGLQRFAMDNFMELAGQFYNRSDINIATAEGLGVFYNGMSNESLKTLHALQEDMFGKKDDVIRINMGKFSDKSEDKKTLDLPDLLHIIPSPPFSKPLPADASRQDIVWWTLKNFVAGICSRPRIQPRSYARIMMDMRAELIASVQISIFQPVKATCMFPNLILSDHYCRTLTEQKEILHQANFDLILVKSLLRLTTLLRFEEEQDVSTIATDKLVNLTTFFALPETPKSTTRRSIVKAFMYKMRKLLQNKDIIKAVEKNKERFKV